MENRAPNGHGEPAEAPSSSQMSLILVGIDCRDLGGATHDLYRPSPVLQRFFEKRHSATTASACLRVSLQTEVAPAQEPGQVDRIHRANPGKRPDTAGRTFNMLRRRIAYISSAGCSFARPTAAHRVTAVRLARRCL